MKATKKKIKKSAPAKKRFSKQPKKSVPRKNQNSNMALATISYNDIIQPITYGGTGKKGELTLLASHFPDKVIKFISSPTPPKYIQKRPGTGGKEFDYVAGWYAKKCLNYVFGFNHSFEIKHREICGTSAIVEGRLIINEPKTGRQILFKDDIGGHQIRFLKDKAKTAEFAVDIANDYKSAATDALKRCMAQMGFFSDVYGASEAKADGNYVNGRPDVQASQPQENTYENVHVVEIKNVKEVKPQTDYIAKLESYLEKHPKGPFSVREKIEFVKGRTKIFIPNWGKLTQADAQKIIATLMYNKK